jgi:hypothetical protein
MYDNNNDDFDFGTDLNDVNEQEFDLIPAGKYPVQCVLVEHGSSKAGGMMIKAKFEVVGGDHANRKIFENYNVQSTSTVAVNIALGQIKKWLAACNIDPNQRLTLNLLRQLEGREFLASIIIQADKTGAYRDQNRINKYEAITGANVQPAPRPSAQAAPVNQNNAGERPPAPQPAAATAGKMPWQV